MKLSNVLFFSIQVDYFERAKRVEEIPLLEKQHEEDRVQAEEFWVQQQVASQHPWFYLVTLACVM